MPQSRLIDMLQVRQMILRRLAGGCGESALALHRSMAHFIAYNDLRTLLSAMQRMGDLDVFMPNGARKKVLYLTSEQGKSRIRDTITLPDDLKELPWRTISQFASLTAT